MAEIEDLAGSLRAFADARDWAQFHSLRNLGLALPDEVVLGYINDTVQDSIKPRPGSSAYFE